MMSTDSEYDPYREVGFDHWQTPEKSDEVEVEVEVVQLVEIQISVGDKIQIEGN